MSFTGFYRVLLGLPTHYAVRQEHCALDGFLNGKERFFKANETHSSEVVFHVVETRVPVVVDDDVHDDDDGVERAPGSLDQKGERRAVPAEPVRQTADAVHVDRLRRDGDVGDGDVVPHRQLHRPQLHAVDDGLPTPAPGHLLRRADARLRRRRVRTSIFFSFLYSHYN